MVYPAFGNCNKLTACRNHSTSIPRPGIKWANTSHKVLWAWTTDLSVTKGKRCNCTEPPGIQSSQIFQSLHKFLCFSLRIFCLRLIQPSCNSNSTLLILDLPPLFHLNTTMLAELQYSLNLPSLPYLSFYLIKFPNSMLVLLPCITQLVISLSTLLFLHTYQDPTSKFVMYS